MSTVRTVASLSLWLLTETTTANATADCNQAEALMAEARNAATTEAQIAALQQSLELCPSPEARGLLALVRLGNGQYAKAIEDFDEAIRAAGEQDLPAVQAQSLAGKGEALAKLERGGEAIAHFDLAAELYRATGMKPPAKFIEDYRKLTTTQSARPVAAKALTATLAAREHARSAFKVVSRRPEVKIQVLFGYDSKDLDGDNLAQTRELGETLSAARPDYRIELIGHTDQRGSADYNQTLSEQRAHSVLSYLDSNYPKLSGRLTATGKGKREPRFSGDDEESRRLNRRVEVVLRDGS